MQVLTTDEQKLITDALESVKHKKPQRSATVKPHHKPRKMIYAGEKPGFVRVLHPTKGYRYVRSII